MPRDNDQQFAESNHTIRYTHLVVLPAEHVHLEVLPCHSDVFVLDSGTLVGVVGGLEILAQIKAFVLLALFYVVRGGGVCSARLFWVFGLAGKRAGEFVENELGLLHVDMVCTGMVGAEGAVVAWRVCHASVGNVEGTSGCGASDFI